MRLAVILLGTLMMAGCAARGPGGAAASTEPRIAWELRTGGSFGDRRLACGSAQSNSSCTLDASTEKEQTTVSVDLYVHPTDQLTNYSGLMRLPFIQGWSPLNARDISASVPPESRPVQTSVSGLVTMKPGEYMLRIALDTVKPATRETDRITVNVSVVVK